MTSTKTPVSLLQEVGAKRGLTPHYELLANQGPTHEPLYVFKCVVGEWEAQAKGTSKRKAKHYVALLVLYKMMKSSMDTPSDSNKLFVEEVKSAASGLLGHEDQLDIFSHNPGLTELLKTESDDVPLSYPINDEEAGNPVGALQEYCQRNMWPQPTYDYKIYPQPHSSICILKLWKWQVEAKGNSRKIAKRKGAIMMLDKLKMENLTIPREMLEMIEEGTLKLSDDEEPKLEGVKKTKLMTDLLQRAFIRNLSGIYDKNGISINLTPNEKRLAASSYKYANGTDQQTSGKRSPDYVDSLQDICDRFKLTPVYTYISNTKSGSLYCLLNLNTDPMQTIRGVGKNVNQARQHAAHQCISFIANMIHPVILREN